MTQPIASPVSVDRTVALPPHAGDDLVMPFAVPGLDVRGRVVHLGPALDAILSRHAYPEPVSKLLAEAITLTVLLGSALKFDGRFILQTQTKGPVHLLVVDYTTPDKIRAYAGFDADAVAAALAAGQITPTELMGDGHLAMTIDQGPDMQRYQGIVALDGETLEDAAHRYFAQSEQIPTRVRLAVAELFTSQPGQGLRRAWRAGGFLMQFLPEADERQRRRDLPGGDAPAGVAAESAGGDDEAWVEASLLAATVEAIELTDPDVTAERLLFRLFHERGVRVFEPTKVIESCRCSRERVVAMLRQFSADDKDHMVEDGRIGVTCEFCSTRHWIDPAELAP